MKPLGEKAARILPPLPKLYLGSAQLYFFTFFFHDDDDDDDDDDDEKS